MQLKLKNALRDVKQTETGFTNMQSVIFTSYFFLKMAEMF